MTILRPRRRRRDGEVRPGDNPADQGKRWRLSGDVLAGLPLAIPMAAGAVLSFGGQYAAAVPWFRPAELAILVPLAIDGAILACAVEWIYAARNGRPASGWRGATHFFVAITVGLNYLATPALPYVPVLGDGDQRALAVGLHIGGAVVWAVLAELLARAMVRRHKEEEGEPDRIPLALWVTEFRESWRTKVRMWRTSERNAAVARVEADRCELALVRLGRALSGEAYADDLDMFRRRLAAGSIRPLDVLDAIESSRVESSESSRVDGRVESSRVDPDALVDRCVELALAASRVEDESSEESSEESSRVELEESTHLAVESRSAPSPVVASTGVEAVDRPASPGVSGAGVARASRGAVSGGVKPAVRKAADAIKAAQEVGQLPTDLEEVKAEPARQVIGASWSTANQALKYLATQNGHTNGHRPA